ncbi:MAG: flagellar motor switch protein FliM [Stellaceae bacterium]
MSDAREQPGPIGSYALFTDQGPASTRMPTLEPTLNRINDRFSRFLRATLLQHLRRGVEVASGRIEMVRHRELIERFTLPTYIALVNMKPLHGTILIALDAPLVVAIVESRFGGTGRFPMRTGNRDFTAFELKSMRRVLDATLDQFALAWEPFGTFEPEVARLETNPQFAGFAPAEEMIIVTAFEVQIDQGRGRLVICIPYPSVEPMHGELMSGIVEDTIERDIRWSDELRSGLEQAPITLNVELGEIEISVADLAALRPGNVFEMDRPETLTVESGGVPLFRGRWGRYGRKIGVRIEERLSRPPETRKNGGFYGR